MDELAVTDVPEPHSLGNSNVFMFQQVRLPLLYVQINVFFCILLCYIATLC